MIRPFRATIIFVIVVSVLSGCGKRHAPGSPFVSLESPTPALSAEAIQKISDYATFLLNDHAIEFHTVVLDSLNGSDIERKAEELVRERRIGRRTKGARGLLLLVALQEQKVRFEVGYDLEPLFTDTFVGYIETKQMAPFFETGQVGVGIEATVEMIVTRVGGDKTAPRAATDGDPSGRPAEWSGGGGASHLAPIGVTSSPDVGSAPPELAGRYKPTATPEEAFSLYLETCRLGIKSPDLEIYSDQDRIFFKNWTVTDAQMQNYLRDYEGQSYRTEIQDGRAVLVFPAKKRKLMPVFLTRERGGWVLDFKTSFDVLKYSQHPYWYLKSADHPYMFALHKYYRFDKLGYPHPKKGMPEDW